MESTQNLNGALIGHVSPDWDCITALWLLARFRFQDEDYHIVLVPAGARNLGDGPRAIVDNGGEYDEARLRFDHDHDRNLPRNTSATTLVAANLRESSRKLLWARYLDPLLKLVEDGDHGRPAAEQSRRNGIHALLSEIKRKRMFTNDNGLVAWGFSLLDAIERALFDAKGDYSAAWEQIVATSPIYQIDIANHQAAYVQAEAEYESKIVYRSADGLLVGLDGGTSATTQIAYDRGARVVVWHSPMPEANTIAVGVNRHSETGVSAGGLVEECLRYAAAGMMGGILWEAVTPELTTWYQHPAGFFAGRGTPKNPDPTPIRVPLALIAEAIDCVWAR